MTEDVLWPDKEAIKERLISRLNNCKFETAYNYAKMLKFKKSTLAEFKKASIELANCGWGGTLINETSEKLVKLVEKELK